MRYTFYNILHYFVYVLRIFQILDLRISTNEWFIGGATSPGAYHWLALLPRILDSESIHCFWTDLPIQQKTCEK